MNRNVLSIALMCLALIVSACKESSVITPPTDDNNNNNNPAARMLTSQQFRELQARLQLAPEQRTLNGSQGGIVTTTRGTRFNFPARSFYRNGEVFEGSVRVDIQENFTKGAALLNNMPTIDTDGNFLVSAGSLSLQAFTENGEQLTIGGNIPVRIPAITQSGFDTDMRLYRGDTTAEGSFSWREVSPNEGSINWNTRDPSGFELMLRFDISDSWRWINLDKPLEEGQPTTITARVLNLPETVNPIYGGRVFLLLEDQFVITPFMWSGDGANYVRPHAPAGLRGRIVAYAADSEILYYGTTDVFTIEANGEYEVTLSTVPSENDLKALLGDL